MVWPVIIAAATTAYSANRAKAASSKASKAIGEGLETELGFARESRDLSNLYQQPYREAGYTALNALHTLTGLKAPDSVRGTAQYGDEYLGVGRNAQPDLYGGGNTPLDAEGVSQAYRDILGRDPDEGGLNYYLNESVKRGGRDGIVPSIPGSNSVTENIDLFGLAKKEGRRGAFTYDEIAAAHRGSAEYQERLRAGTLPPNEAQRIGNPAASANYTGPYGKPPEIAGEEGGTAGAAPNQQTPEDFLRADPGYQHRLNEGTRAHESSASARGGFGDPFTRRITRFAQGEAAQEYMAVYNRISNVAGLGQVAAGYSSQAAMQFGQQAGQAASNAAYTRASGYVAQGNATQNAIGQAAQGLGYYFANRGSTGGAQGYGGVPITNSWSPGGAGDFGRY